MPEGDIVHRLATRLRPALDGRELAAGALRHTTADLDGRTVLGHETHGKHLLQRFSGGLTLHTHLRLDGSWTVTRPGRRVPRTEDVRVRLAVRDGPTAWGIGIPVVELLDTRDEHRVVGHLGPDPLRDDWDEAEAVRRIGADPARPVLEAIRDQRNLAGLGNLWVNELCFLRGLHPDRPVAEVDVPALVRLAARALRHSATTPAAYQVTTGDRRRGEQHWVVGRASRPCLRCGTLIRARGEHPGRTYWCGVCQTSSGRRPAAPGRSAPAGPAADEERGT